MAIKLEFHAIKGMLRDLTRSKFSPEFAFDALNIRLTAREGNTLLSVTNEKGTKECILKDSTGETIIKGDYVGHCVLNNYLVLFTYISIGGSNKIYRLEHKDDYFEVVELYSGWLNISTDHPIETLGVYETDEVLKVYWTDNYNPIRYINIAKVYQDSTNFDLVKPISVATLKVWKKLGSGSFSSGVVQYALTYYNLYGSETNIFAISDLNYCAFENRGASPEETVNCSFELYIPTENSIRTEYEYIRIYSIHRTSLDAVPTIKVVADIRTSNLTKPTESLYSLYTDAGTTGYTVDPTLLQYIGGLDLIAKTLTTKDNTLFAGGITLTKHVIPESVRTALKGLRVNFKLTEEFSAGDLESSYPFTNLLEMPSRWIKGFKAREWYRFGVLALNGDGEWSEVIYIGDYECNILPEISGDIPLNIKVPMAYLLIPEVVRRTLLTNNYIGIRGVCVYPNFNDRSVICQGVLCPTVFNLQDRCDDSPYALSSWFTRPTPCDNSWESEYISEDQLATHNVTNPIHKVTDGEVLEFNHLAPIYGNIKDVKNLSGDIITRKVYNITRGEVLTGDYFITYKTSDDLDYIGTNRGSFGVDSGIVTMYSPDIEFDDSVGYLKDADLKFRIIGAVMMANTLSDISITTTTTGYYNDVGFIGNPIKNRTTYYSMKNKNRSGRCMATAPFWSALPKTDGDYDIKTQLIWAVYPWHRSGSLIGSGVPEEGEKRLWELKRKIMSNLWISSHTKYFDSYYEPHSGISPVNTWHSGDGLIKIKAINNPNRGFYTYYGDIDKVISYNAANNEKVSNGNSDRKANGYDLFLAPVANTGPLSLAEIFTYFNGSAEKAIDKHTFILNGKTGYNNIYLKTKDAVGVEPVSMKYKSGPHAVFAFNYITKTLLGEEITMDIPMQYILPNNGYNINNKSSNWYTRLWDESPTSYIQDTLTFDNPNNLAFLWLGELYRETVNNRFGGNSEEAILNNTWEVAGEAVSLTLGDKDYILINFSGDTYIQRYDALRTYEYTSEDTNSIVDILSFMCETRINIDGRYDRNRGNISNLTITPLNFNLLNPIYSLRDNYFNYHTLDYKRFSNNYFPNTIVWSKEKSNAEEVDSWSNLNMLSSLDLDGDKGEIESLNTFNNEIYCFQKKGLSNILFNSRVLIPVSDGVPIEMTNGLKVSGKRYISNTIGCSNKWSIAETPAGLYFIDNETNSLYLFNGLIQSLSDKLGFRLWIGENNSHELWDPINYKNFRTYYDKNNDDVYFINDKTCLCYSELLNQFTSFMSYEKVPAMFNINSEFYSFNKGKLWHNFEGNYNMFYGEFKPYSITIVANSDEPYDKIFNTVEFRSDSWNDNVLINHATFDTLEVWNEYLYGKSTLATVLGHPSALKKKFRIWRANIPRDTSNHRDRIRNTWAYVKLSMNTANTWRTEFHDMNIYYFI